MNLRMLERIRFDGKETKNKTAVSFFSPRFLSLIFWGLRDKCLGFKGGGNFPCVNVDVIFKKKNISLTLNTLMH